MKTYSTKLDDIKRKTHTLDAADQILGRLAARVATLLMGKNKTIFVRNLDIGDFVTVINAGQIKISGRKLEQKKYYRHSGYPGGFRSTSMDDMMATHPERVIEFAVKGMLPPNRLRARMMKRLHVYSGTVPTPKVSPLPTTPATEKKEEKING